MKKKQFLHRVIATAVTAATALSLLPALPLYAAEAKPNDTADTATVISVGSKTTEALQDKADVDYYKVEITDIGYFTLTFAHKALTNATSSWNIALYDATGKQKLQSYESNGNVATSTTQKLNYAAGTYLIRVTYPDYYYSVFSDTPYTLTVNSTADPTREIEPNNEADTAVALATGDTATGTLLTEEDVDVYRVEITDTGYFTIDFMHEALASLGPDFGFSLYDEADDVPLQSWNVNGDADTFTTQKLNYPAGVYLIKVFYPDHHDSEHSSADYRLTVNSTADAQREMEHNNTKDTAAALSVKKKIVGSMVSPTDVDFYKIKITTTGYFTWTFAHTALDTTAPCWTATLLAADGVTPITTYSYTGNAGSVTSKKINYPAGVYYLKVTASSAQNAVYTDTDYTIVFKSVSEAAREIEENNTKDAATPLTLGTAAIGSVFTTEDLDFYRFELEKPTTVTISLTHDTLKLTGISWCISLFRADGVNAITEELMVPANANLKSANLKLEAGVYYLRVSTPQKSTFTTEDYTLSVDALQYTLGDVDENGIIDAMDAIVVLKDYSATLLGAATTLTENQQLAANINEDDAINVNDAVLILRYYAKSMLGPITWKDLLGR